jgi:ABC-type lipoprotein release transport system permease subunit
VRPADPTTFFGVPVALLIVSLLAAYAPARHAMKPDPMRALKHEMLITEG